MKETTSTVTGLPVMQMPDNDAPYMNAERRRFCSGAAYGPGYATAGKFVNVGWLVEILDCGRWANDHAGRFAIVGDEINSTGQRVYFCGADGNMAESNPSDFIGAERLKPIKRVRNAWLKPL